MLKYCFKTLILLRSSRKEFEKMSVESTNEFKIPHKVRDFFVYAELLKACFHKAKCEQKNRCEAADLELSAWELKRSA